MALPSPADAARHADIDPLSVWEVVVRMETKLDIALTKLDDHEERLRAAVPRSELEAVIAKVELLATEQNVLKSAGYVTPKSMLVTMATVMTLLVALFGFVNQYVVIK